MPSFLILRSQKGSLPLTRIRAHNSKIYGIDWSHNLRNEIVTCSLDKSIKVWDVSESRISNMYGGRPANVSFLSKIKGNEENEFSIRGPLAQCDPIRIINTHYPVWRARYLPFGRHTDVVKEFVWRKGDYGTNYLFFNVIVH